MQPDPQHNAVGPRHRSSDHQNEQDRERERALEAAELKPGHQGQSDRDHSERD